MRQNGVPEETCPAPLFRFGAVLTFTNPGEWGTFKFLQRKNTTSPISRIARTKTLRPRCLLPTGPFERAFTRAVSQGLMAANQSERIAREVRGSRPCSLLVMGGGHDADLWCHCAEGNINYVEDNPAYLSLIPGNAMRVKFKTQVGVWRKVPAPPRAIARPWDFVIVDGPTGHSPACPGRQIPIAWASQLARKTVFVHDYERPWERAVCDRYLGEPSEIVEPQGGRKGRLAIFRV
jgi:hypothetical protein